MKDQKILTLNKYLEKYNKMSDSDVSKYSLKTIFSVVDKGKQSYFNISKTINFQNLDKVPTNYYKSYTVKEFDNWPNLSYKFYNTIKLWWILCKFNQVVDPFQDLIVGSVIKIPNKEFILEILDSLS